MTYLRLVPVASRKAAGVSGARDDIASAWASSVAIGRARIGEVGLEDDDPARPLERADAVGRAAGARAASLSAGGAATASARSSRSIAAAMVGSGSWVAGAVPGRRSVELVADEAPVADQLIDQADGGRRRRVPAERDAAAERPGGDGPGGGQASWLHRPPRRPPCRRRRATSGAIATGPFAGSSAPWRSSLAAAIAARSPVPTAVASRATRSSVCRRREIPRGGTTSSTMPPTIRSAPDARRRTNRSPGATAIGRGQPEASRGRSRRAGRARPDRSGRRSPRPPPSRRGGGPATGRAGPGAARRGADRWPRPHGSSVRTDPAVEVARVDPGEVERRPPGLGAIHGRAVDLDLADPDRPVARHEPEGGAADRCRAAERPGHDDAAALDREDAVDGEAGARRAGARCSAVHATGGIPDHRVTQVDQRARNASIPPPSTDETARTGEPARVVPSSSRATAATTSPSAPARPHRPW